MENKLEQLLNSLIEKGWRPFNKDIKEFFTLNEFTCGYRGEGTNHLGTIRAIVSKESGLRQFVCENGMVKEDDGHITRIINLYKSDEVIVDGGWNYHYWLMICSILDESELKDFLLSNIKVDVKGD